jgi:transketolase
MTLKTPATLIFTRQNLPIMDVPVATVREGVARGAYITDDSGGTPQVILLATGSEVQIVREAYQTLTAEGVKARVVSMPSWELFEAQDDAYKASVLPTEVKARVSIEAGVTMGWSKYVGDSGISIGIDHFGASAPYEVLYEKFGLTVEAVVTAAKRLL